MPPAVPRNLLAAAVIALCLLAGTAAAPQEAPDATPAAPQAEGRCTGMAADLWETVTGTLDPRSHYAEIATFAELTGALATGAIDVALTNLTITRDRVERIDFTRRMRAG